MALGFTDDEKINRDPNGKFPLIISASILGTMVGGCLIDEGNPVDILYPNMFECLGLKRENLRYCFGLEEIELNGTNTRPWGCVTLDVTFGDGAGKRTVKVPFLVIPGASTYNCVFGFPTLASLDAMAYTVHLQMKYHNDEGKIVIIHVDLGGIQRLYETV